MRLREIRFLSDSQYPGEGKSAGLARGMLVFLGERNLTREGMGLGSPAFKYPTATVFARAGFPETRADQGIIKEFPMDTRISWGKQDMDVPLLTCALEIVTSMYKKAPWLQPNCLGLGQKLLSRFSLQPHLRPIPSRGETTIKYQQQGHALEIECVITARQQKLPQVCLLNELGADFFSRGWRGGQFILPPSGWEQVPAMMDPTWLCDPDSGWAFSISGLEVEGEAKARLYWGREEAPNLCWAGFIIELTPYRPLQVVKCRYKVEFTCLTSLS